MTQLAPFVGPAHVTDLDDLVGSKVWGDGRIRVLRVIARLNVGGPALQTWSSATCWTRAVSISGSWPARSVRRRVTHVFLQPRLTCQCSPSAAGPAPRPLDDVSALIGLIDVIRRFRPHIVHTHTAKAGVLGRLAAWSCGVPATVHSFHGHLLHGYFSPVGRTAVVGVERVFARRTTRLVAVGDRSGVILLSAGVGRSKQFRVVPPGTRLGALPSPSEAKVALGLRADSVVVTLVAASLPSSAPNGLCSWPQRS